MLRSCPLSNAFIVALRTWCKNDKIYEIGNGFTQCVFSLQVIGFITKNLRTP